MKNTLSRQAFTLVELLISMTVAATAGGALFVLLHGTSNLSAKNTAINVTHQQARQAIHEGLREIHGAVSIPQLVNDKLQPLVGGAKDGPAAGVSYQTLYGGPFLVWENANATSTTIRLGTGGQTLRFADPTKTTGYRLIIPAFQVEEEIVNFAAGTGQTTVVTLKNKLGAKIVCSNAEPAYVAYVTRRSALVVVDGQLQRYSSLEETKPARIIARNVTSPTPFTIPNADNRFVQVDLVARDQRAVSRGFRAVDLQMNLTVPYRYRLTTRQ